MEINVSISIKGALRGSKKVSTPCLIGRSKEAGLTVTHPAMSRKHCELYEEGGKLYLRDNSSLNGTMFGGEYVEEPVCLQLGDTFTVGELAFTVSSASVPLSEEQQEIVNRPTAAISTTEELSIEDDLSDDEAPGMATMLEVPGNGAEDEELRLKDDDAPAPVQKPGKGVSPKDVRIIT